MKQRRTMRDQQREETFERVFAAAIDVIRRDGVEGSRIEDIAELAGVSRGTFYFHFATREEVLLELLRRTQVSLAEQLYALDEEAPLDTVLALLTSHIRDAWSSEPRLLAAVGRVALGSVDIELDQQLAANPGLAALLPRVERAIERGVLSDAVPAPLLTSLLLIQIFAAALVWVRMPEQPMQPLLDGVVQLFLHGAGKGRSSGKS